MKCVHLDNRLNTIASLITKCNCVADIGTDHGLLPCFIIQSGIANLVIASDVAQKPLLMAKKNIDKYNLSNQVKLVLSDGLNALNDYKVDCVIIAGMGGHLIAKILNDSSMRYSHYILQANSHCDVLRKYLSDNEFTIFNEEIVVDDNKFYEIIEVTLGSNKLDECQIKYGPINLIKKSEEFIKKHQERLNTINKILLTLDKSSSSYDKLLKEQIELSHIIND